MNDSGPQLTIGVEEEYLLVDKDSRALVIDPPDGLMASGRSKTAKTKRARAREDREDRED